MLGGRSPRVSTDKSGPTHDLAHTPAFGSSEGLFHIPGSLSPPLKILGVIPKKQTYKRALQRRYLERTCVHACIQLCTRGYTVVYTRVYSSLLGRRYTLGISTPKARILLSSAYTPPRPCPRTMVISCVGLGEPRPLPDRSLILTHPLTLRTGLPLVHQAPSLNSLCIPHIERGTRGHTEKGGIEHIMSASITYVR